jgi:hypothetical protein
MTPKPSPVEGINPEEDLAVVAELADHLQSVNLHANTFPNALSMLSELDGAVGRLRVFFEAGGYRR